MNKTEEAKTRPPMFGPYKMTDLRVVYPTDPMEYMESHVLKVGMTLVDTGDKSAWKELIAEVKRGCSIGSSVVRPVSAVCPECGKGLEPSEDPWRVEFVHNRTGSMFGFHLVCSRECMEMTERHIMRLGSQESGMS